LAKKAVVNKTSVIIVINKQFYFSYLSSLLRCLIRAAGRRTATGASRAVQTLKFIAPHKRALLW